MIHRCRFSDPTCLIHLVMHNKNQTKEATISLSLPASHPKLWGIPLVTHAQQNNVSPPSSQVCRKTQHAFTMGRKTKKRSLCLPSCAKCLLHPSPEVISFYKENSPMYPQRSVKLTTVTNLNVYSLPVTKIQSIAHFKSPPPKLNAA